MALGMVDIYDRAQQRDAENLADALAAQQRRAGQVAGPALSHCEDCGEPIPAARRAAVAGCRRCIDCQMLREKQKTGGHHG
jgi:phage/conjugal plasmid C-4 type zinc finger TraR family protein